MDTKISITGFTDYITSEDETFDSIAFKLYGEEQMRDILMEHNPDLIPYIIFPAGIVMNAPVVERIESVRTKAPWAR